MMLSEFEKLTGLEVTTAEYEKIEAEYMESPDDKAKFCKMWLKKGGLQRLHNARLEEIEHLKKTIEDLEHKLDEEQDWQISHKYGTHYQKTSYDYVGCRANYARFDVRCCGGSMQWELVDGALKDYSTPPFLSDGEQ